MGPETRNFEQPEAGNFDAKAALQKARGRLIGQALKSREGIAGLKAWRSLSNRSKGVRQARTVFENLSAYDLAVSGNPEQAGAFGAEMANKTSLGSGRVQELLSCFEAKQLGATLPEVRPEVRQIFQNVLKSRSTEGEVDVAQVMSSANVSLGGKFQWFESRLASAIDFLERKDLEEARAEAEKPIPPEIQEQKEQSPQSNLPPPQEDSLTPSMDEMETSKENEPGAYFKVRPFYGGYYRGDDFDIWDEKVMKWKKSASMLSEFTSPAIEEKSRKVFSGSVQGGRRTVLPMPYGFAPDVSSLRTQGNETVTILADGHGSFVVDAARASGVITFSLEIAKTQESLREAARAKSKAATYKFSPGTDAKLAEITQGKHSIMDQARSAKAYVKKLLKYSNDSSFNNIYRTGDPAGYFSRIEQHEEADCDVANTYFVALLRRLGMEARLVSGHYVKVKDKQNAAVISSGTGHAWAEVWDGRAWQRLDATPPGDPNMDDEEIDEQSSDAAMEGDFGEQEAPELSDEELEQLITEAQEALEKKEREPEELAALNFAEQAGCSPEEAKQILKRITEAREKRDKQGRNIRARLLAEWQKIIQDNLIDRTRYTAPIRMSRGEELVDPVETVLDLRAGEADPTGFSKHERKTEKEQIYGGFDAFLVVDKSGSMAETDGSSGRPKWEDQQVFSFLLMDSMYAAAQEFKRQKIKLISPMDVRVALVSFNAGGGRVELPLGTAWGPKEQLQVWKALQENVGGGTPDHLGLQTVKKMIEQDAVNLQQSKQRLRLVLVSADGGSDSVPATISAKEDLKSAGVVVKAAGIGSGASQVIATYTPDGSNLASFADAPDWAAEEIITQAKLLNPKKVKR